MSRIAIFALLTVLATASPGLGQSITWVPGFTLTDLSADGHVAVGLTQFSLDAARWTAAGGLENIGGSSAHLGIGAGEPKTDADGSHVCATIAAADSSAITQGLWTRADGWQELPLPAGGIQVDLNLASAWNISSDGSTVVGLFWLPPARAHASTWNEAGGPVDLGSQGHDSRANAVSGDGSVIAGWSAYPTTGAWQPSVWENGVMTVLSRTLGTGECAYVNPAGDMIAGQMLDPGSDRSVAALYFRDEADSTGWAGTPLGFLPGTNAIEGRSMALDAAVDGSIVIGLNYFSTFSLADFVWTPTYGMMRTTEFLTQEGVSLPATFRVQRIKAVSDDGRYIAGYGYDLYTPQVTESFIVDLGGVAPVPGTRAAASLELEPNFPNPFNPSTTIAFELARADDVVVAIHDTRGRRVRTLFEGSLESGRHIRVWNGRNDAGMAVASGIYLAVATDGSGRRSMQRMTLVK